MDETSISIIENHFVKKELSLSKSSQRLRWNLLFNFVLWPLISLPLWLPFIPLIPKMMSLYILVGIQGLFQLFFVVISLFALNSFRILLMNKNKEFIQNVKVSSVQHLVLLSCYKEPLQLLETTIQSIANQTLANKLIMVVGFEEKSPEYQSKQLQLLNKFESSFHEIIFTVHPYGVNGEIPGKCSNSNYALRTSLALLQKKDSNHFNPSQIIITNCDADSRFHPKYIEALTSVYNEQSHPHECVYQAPLFYNWNLDAVSCITRVTGLIRSYLMMGAMIPFNINTMSIFSFSASLCIAGDYIHPGYQMDDIIALIRWMSVTKKTIKNILVPVPVISGPTSGRTVEDEIEEWARQARRWTIGAAEVFHYFLIKSKNIPICTALSWGFTFFIYYGILLCGSSLYNLSLNLSLAFIFDEVPKSVQWILYAYVILSYMNFLVMFILDRLILQFIVPRVKERISVIRNFLHFLMTPFVLFFYSLIELYAYHEIVFRGKKVCKHGASKKETLMNTF